MLADILSSFGAGAIFGTALTVSGVYKPEVIIGQLRMQDFHMLEVFLSATAISALVLMSLEHWGIAKRSVRSNSSLHWFSQHDGNIFGGALIGAGMSLTGACPGTILVQVGHGTSSSLWTILGAITGGVFFAKYGKPSIASHCHGEITTQAGPQTIAARFGVRERTVFFTFEALVMSIVIISSTLLPGRGSASIPTLFGGVLVGGIAQTTSMLLTGNSLGVSTAYEHIGAYLWKALNYDKISSKPPTMSRPVIFALGIIGSSFMLSIISSATTGPGMSIAPARALLGGFMLSYGARVAGGCTSGHGVSGLSMLSYSSLITVAFMFASGMLVSAL